jgi:hypothetical protein
MSTSARRFHVEGVAPGLCVRLGSDVMPGLVGCSCVQRTVRLTFPGDSFTIDLAGHAPGHATDGFVIRFGRRTAACATPRDWRIALAGRTTADRLAAAIVTEVTRARGTLTGVAVPPPVLAATRRAA